MRGSDHLAIGCAAVLLLLGLTGSWAAGLAAESLERRNGQALLERRAAVAGWALGLEVKRYQDTVAALASAVGAQQELTAADFATITAPTAEAGFAGASAVTFAVPAVPSAVEATSGYWQDRGADPFRVAGDAPEHVFAVFSRTLDGGAPGAPGRDLSVVAEPTRVMQSARVTGKTLLSDAFVLLRDRDLPAAERQMSFVMAAPVRDPAGAFRGWLLMTVRAGDLATGTLTDAAQGLINVRLEAERSVAGDGAVAPAVTAAEVHNGPVVESAAPREVVVPMAQQRWMITVQSTADAEHLVYGPLHLGAVLKVAGSALTVLLATLVWSLLSARRRAERQVRAATAALRTAEADARRQAVLLDAVVSSIGDGVGVVDGSGQFLLHNRAAMALLGVDEDADDPHEWQEHYGLFLPDGQTPFPLEDLPLTRALAGESTDNVDMVVRHAAGPDPVMITVTGRPLDASAGVAGGGAVAVFHDVTEPRRLQSRLAAQSQVHARLIHALSDLGEGGRRHRGRAPGLRQRRLRPGWWATPSRSCSCRTSAPCRRTRRQPPSAPASPPSWPSRAGRPPPAPRACGTGTGTRCPWR